MSGDDDDGGLGVAADMLTATHGDVMRREHRALRQEQQGQVVVIKDVAMMLWAQIDALGPSREAALAKTKVEEAVLWATKAATAAK